MSSSEGVVDFTQKPAQKAPEQLFIPQGVQDFFLGKNLVHSVLSFALFNLCFYLVSYAHFSLLSIALHLLLVNLVVTILVITVMTVLHKFNAGPAPPASAVPVQLDADAISRVVASVVTQVNKWLVIYGRWRSCSNIPQSVLAVLALYIGAKIANHFSLSCITYLVGLAAFVIPPLYHHNKTLIDQQLHIVNGKVLALYTDLYNKLPPNLQQAADSATGSINKSD